MNRRKTHHKELKDFLDKRVECTGTVCTRKKIETFVTYGVNDGNMNRTLLIDVKVNGKTLDHVWIKSEGMEDVKEGDLISFVSRVRMYNSIRGAFGYGFSSIQNVKNAGQNPNYESMKLKRKDFLIE